MRCLILFLYILLLIPFGTAQASAKKKQILIISSYNPDTRRVDELVTNLSNTLNNNNFDHELLVESLNIINISNLSTWTFKLNSILEGYSDVDLTAIVLVGQEVWSASLSGGVLPKDTPVFAVNASRYGVLLTDSAWSSNDNSIPQNVDMQELATKTHKLFGGYLYDYDIDQNIKLIQRLFPSVKEVAFVSDNTYGGIALNALMRASEDQYPEISFKYIDARLGEKNAIAKVEKLSPETSAILMATWRVDGDNRHMTPNSLVNILSYNKFVPVISLTSISVGGVEIGGYVPKYKENGSSIANQIIDLRISKDSLKVNFNLLDKNYRFSKDLIEEYQVVEYRIPKDAVIFSSSDQKIQKYKHYISLIIAITVLLLIILIYGGIILRNNIALKHNLQKRESELIIARDKAQESDRLKSSFLANMSHEIRTPLNAIVGFSSIISEQEGLSEESKECQRIISDNSEMLLALINDILDLSRLEFGNAQFEMSDVNVRDLCKSAMYSASCSRKDTVEGILSLPDDNCIIDTDFRRIMQVLNNLLGNANKFTSSGYIKLSYMINYSENRVYFYIEDTGCGVPLDKQKTIFDRFEKIDEFKQGAGLGLSICKNILTHLDSEMWIDSTYTGGARFVFSYKIKEII